MFPKSLRGYVERALARCKDDKQMAACQAVMKEVSFAFILEEVNKNVKLFFLLDIY
jgi:hypothetical protein